MSSVYKEREKLVASLRDRQSVAGVLSKIIGFVLFLVCVIIFVTLLGVDWLSLIAPFGTAVLAISFVFGSVASSAFKSFVFLIFVNPYDVGDRVTANGITVKVSKISLLSTTFFTPDGKKVIMSNSILADTMITNHTRSREVSLGVDFDIDVSTPSLKVALLKDSLTKWLKINRLEWDTELGFYVTGVNDRRSLGISLWVSLISINWGQVGLYLDRKTELICFLKETLDSLQIICYTSLFKVVVDQPFPHLLSPGRDSDGDDPLASRRDREPEDDNISEIRSQSSQIRPHFLSADDAIPFPEAKRQHSRYLKKALDAVKLISPKSPLGTPPLPLSAASTPPASAIASPDIEASGLKQRKKKKMAPAIEITPAD